MMIRSTLLLTALLASATAAGCATDDLDASGTPDDIGVSDSSGPDAVVGADKASFASGLLLSMYEHHNRGGGRFDVYGNLEHKRHEFRFGNQWINDRVSSFSIDDPVSTHQWTVRFYE